MTGALVIDVLGGNASSLGLNVKNTISGARLVVSGTSTFSGAVTIRNKAGGDAAVGLNVSGTMSGRVLYISGTGAANVPVLNVRDGKIGINTTDMEKTLHVKAPDTNPIVFIDHASAGYTAIDRTMAGLELHRQRLPGIQRLWQRQG
jgi:hypothetical protein